ncbi:DEAD/DEAH box helicase family protein [Xanthobacteraceae bacterium A53D]
MVDFKKLREGKSVAKPGNPRDIFNFLPKPQGINDLYASQADVLDAWLARKNEKDLVVKLHTGGGKTLVALLMAQSIMNETGDPVLYLAPTNQLVNQVIVKSREYGISTTPYTKGQPLPNDFHDGKSVLVGAYETLFTGRSKFGVRGDGRAPIKVGAIILDDAHVALTSIRDAFTLTISVKDHQAIYADFVGRFRTAFRDVGRSGTFSDITNGKDYGVIEVPSWAWHRKIPEIQSFISQHVENIDPFVWPFLRDNLSLCHCLIGRGNISITPIFPLVDLLPTFEDCPRRIYMSATIADDSEIVRAFGAAPEAVSKPITSTSLAGVGERMILVPELMNLGGALINPIVKKIASHLSSHKKGVAILAPSSTAAKRWTDIATYAETSQAVADRVAQMQSASFFGPLALANRYDGIDLAGDACRLLIMDDLPQGASNYDVFRMNVVANSAVASLLAQRIEQGIGRGTRGGGDHCVVILMGSKLVAWIGRKNNLSHLTASTRAQLKMGQEVSDAVTSPAEIAQTVLKCLNRDSDWVAYHASELAAAAHAAPIDAVALRVAGAERKAFRQQRLGQFEPSIQTLEKLISDSDLQDDIERRAWIFALAARNAYLLEDEARGQKFQTSAYVINNNHTPPKVRPSYIPRPVPGKQAGAIVSLILEYDQRAAIISEFDEAVSQLVPEAPAGRYEEALASLGSFLGFESERPEKTYGVGPDVLWRTDGAFDFVIEAKSEKEENSPLYKKDHAQLLESEHWFKHAYPGRAVVRVSALPEAIADARATPMGSFALRLDEITRIVTSLRGVLIDLISIQGESDVISERCEASLVRANLKPDLIRAIHLKPFGKK